METPNHPDANQELALLSFAIRLILAELDHRVLIERGLESFADFGRCDRVAVFLLDPARETLTAAGCVGAVLGASPVQSPVAGTPFDEVMQAKQPGRFQLDYLENVPFPTYGSGLPDRQCFCVPLVEANNRALGVVVFDQSAGAALDATATQCLLILQSVLAISLENARALEELQRAHAELETLYQAKTKMIDHLSHELKTPLAVLSASSKILRKASVRRDDERFVSVLDRMERSIKRLVELEEEAGDIAKQRESRAKFMLEGMIRQCRDLLETLMMERDAPAPLVTELTRRIEEVYLPPVDDQVIRITFGRWIPNLLAAMEPFYRHRHVRLELDLPPGPDVRMPEGPLRKVICGLVRNAIENTPDGGWIRIASDRQDGALILRVRDSGVGLKEEEIEQLFHGFFHTGDTDDYSSGKPFDFKAGGKGLDLMRSKLFSERYGFDLQVESEYGAGSVFFLKFPPSMLSPTTATPNAREVK